MNSIDDSRDNNETDFSSLGLAPAVLQALHALGYEQPTPIQQRIIPSVLAGRDVLGQAQTGTGKTAAFSLPMLSNIDLSKKDVQALILAPTRELAIQVAEAIHSYAASMPGFQVLPIYGGQNYTAQLRPLKRGVHVVVGTPGRVIDHIKRGTLKLDALRMLVLDEADEMLRMGFVDDVEWVLEQTPADRQVALFSATMPKDIRRIAQRHLKDPDEVCIQVRTTTAETIRQRYWVGHGGRKLDVLTRILEAEDDVDATIVFVRTRNACSDLVEKLDARGYACAALNGEMAQAQREQVVEQLKKGKLDVVIATDVAARGLDVERISHVVNYDVPHDTESYVHRIGRTGRAGRKGDAILLLTPRERRMLNAIERATRQKLEVLELASTAQVNDKRIERFKARLESTLEHKDIPFFSRLLEEFHQQSGAAPIEIAAALAILLQGDEPLLLDESAPDPSRSFNRDDGSKRQRKQGGRRQGNLPVESGMDRYRLAVGRKHGLRPEQVVGIIAKKARISGSHIGRIDIREEFSTVDLPEGMPPHVFHALKNARVAGHPLLISKFEGGGHAGRKRRQRS